MKDAPTLTKIPGAADLLCRRAAAARGDHGPRGAGRLAGALPITYRIGPGPARVHLKVAFNWDTKPLYDVIARMPGRTFPTSGSSAAIITTRGSTAPSDPVSGAAVLLEEARALGELRKQGWAPKRTMVYAAWDGEEPGLLGSTEWVETHAAELQAQAVVYINTDGNGRGFLSMEGSHTLEQFINDVARDVSDPETKRQRVEARAGAGDLARCDARRGGRDPRSRGPADRRARIGIGLHAVPPARGHRLAQSGLRRRGRRRHLSLDLRRLYHYTQFLDTDFLYGRALAQTVGTAVVRLADADVLPFEFTNLADTVRDVRHRSAGSDQAAAGRRCASATAKSKTAYSPRSTIRGVRRCCRSRSRCRRRSTSRRSKTRRPLSESAKRFSEALAATRSKLAGDNAGLDGQPELQKSERKLLDPAGLPARAWYKHLLYAPGFYTGYGVKTMPGVRESIEQGQYPQAETEIVRVSAVITALATHIDSITSDMLRAPVKNETSERRRSPDELVAHPVHGEQVLRVPRVRLDLLTEPGDVHVHGARGRHRVVAPDLVEQLVA